MHINTHIISHFCLLFAIVQITSYWLKHILTHMVVMLVYCSSHVEHKKIRNDHVGHIIMYLNYPNHHSFGRK